VTQALPAGTAGQRIAVRVADGNAYLLTLTSTTITDMPGSGTAGAASVIMWNGESAVLECVSANVWRKVSGVAKAMIETGSFAAATNVATGSNTLVSTITLKRAMRVMLTGNYACNVIGVSYVGERSFASFTYNASPYRHVNSSSVAKINGSNSAAAGNVFGVTTLAAGTVTLEVGSNVNTTIVVNGTVSSFSAQEIL
jgi:hypothetical protein